MIFKKTVDINFDENIIKKNKIPILIKDKTWLYIRKDCKSRTMDALAKDLETLILEEINYQRRLRGIKEKKRALISKLINLSDLVNTQGEEHYISDIEKNKNEIEQLNGEMDQILETLFEYPKKIEQTNLQLLKETVKVSYQNFISNQNYITSLNKEIVILRDRLGNLREKKEESQKKLDVLYGFLHGLVGPEEMEKLDISLEE